MDVLDTVSGWIFDWAGWIVGAIGVGAAIFSARAARRSARAAEGSLEVARRSAGAAESSAEVARDTLLHAQESEDRRARANVAVLAIRVKAEREKTEKFVKNLAVSTKSSAGFFGKSRLLEMKMEELEAVPDELKEYAELAEALDFESTDLSQVSAEDLEGLDASLRSDLTRLEIKSEELSSESRRLEWQLWAERFLEALRKLTLPR